MLVLTRNTRQSIMIGDDIEVIVLSRSGDKVRLGIRAPDDVRILRKEIYEEIRPHDHGGVGSERADVDEALKRLRTD